MKKGILLVNLGTPDAPKTGPVRRYLRKFLSDKRVVDIPRLPWWFILNTMILPTRPKHSAALYQKIWSDDQGSPLLYYTQQQAQQLQKRFPDQMVRYAMCYSKPFINDMLGEMMTLGMEELTIIPMYPQYSQTTVAPIFDQVSDYFKKQANIPQIYFQQSFYQEPLYLNFMAKQIKAALAKNHYDKIIFSYHGIPQKYVAHGDPYAKQCEETTRQVMAIVGDFPYLQTYQSKFGPGQWLTPATAEIMKALPKQGAKRILVLTPAFVADCLETIEEIEQENRGYFMENGGELFTYLHPMNDSSVLTDLLETIVLDHETSKRDVN